MKRGSDLTRSLFNLLYVFAFSSMIPFVEVESVAAQPPSPVPAAVNVIVVNTPEQPVPVTGTVTVGNLGSNPLPATGTMNVGNSGPLLVQNVDNPAMQPVQGFGSCQVVVTRVDCRADLYIVPAGKRLVIEFITIKTVTAGSVETPEVWISTRAGGTDFGHVFEDIPRTGQRNVFGSFAGATKNVRIYADPNSFVTASCFRWTGVEPMDCRVTFSGHLVNVP